jgi:hypothetical protein
MTDIVEKLRMRSASLRGLGGIGHEDADTDDEAADKIETLIDTIRIAAELIDADGVIEAHEKLIAAIGNLK